MAKMSFIPELPYEGLVRRVCGHQWRNLSGRELDGAWGVAIVKSILDGCRSDLSEIASHLGIDRESLQSAYRSLSMNGVFCRDRIESDKILRTDDLTAWSFYAGYASGITGMWIDKNAQQPA